MNAPLQIATVLKDFRCLGDQCPDTCCKGWGIQLDPATRGKYEREAPELLDAVDTGEAEWIMRRDAATDHCVKLEGGLCGIQNKYGTSFLSDACHFFPRVTHGLGARRLMTATLSCPEITRLTLFGAEPLRWQESETDRLHFSLKDHLPSGMSEEEAQTIHQAFLDAVDTAPTAERALMRIASVARSLEMLPAGSWAAATGFYLRTADDRLPAPQPVAEDPFNLLHALYGLLGAAKPSARPRLEQSLAEMTQALAMTQDPATGALDTSSQSWAAWQRLQQGWDAQRAHLDPLLKRWLQIQLTVAFFPFSGFGEKLGERATLLGMRLALVKLGLMSLCLQQAAPQPDDIIRVVQSLSRFLDHLADPTLTLKICEETGWNREARLRALIGDSTTMQ